MSHKDVPQGAKSLPKSVFLCTGIKPLVATPVVDALSEADDAQEAQRPPRTACGLAKKMT
jgi:hypothetical protein